MIGKLRFCNSESFVLNQKLSFAKNSIILICLLLTVGCQTKSEVANSFPAPEATSQNTELQIPAELTKAIYYDKILGLLVGSAIGDAMGAPVEMWDRGQIEIQYGHIDSLVHVVREGSPEGPWEDNMVPGSTTDDTRWKYLMGNYLTTQPYDSLDDVAFANSIIAVYLSEMKELQSVEAFDPEPIEQQLRHMTWLQEWAKVAKPFAENNLRGYSYALNRFYGGEMACAGMLYAPMVGGFYPGRAVKSYQESYRLGIFDIGYARDIMALTSGYVSQAMQPQVAYDSIIGITPLLDPLRFANSRLIGRLAYQSLMNARNIVYQARAIQLVEPDLQIPKRYKRSELEYAQLLKAYELLEQQLQDIPFHAGEIHLINLTALEYSQGDFRLAMEFITNFGRDNDTVAAVTGAILGAYHGYNNLPPGLAKPVLNTSRKVVGIDLEELAQQMTDKLFPNPT